MRDTGSKRERRERIGGLEGDLKWEEKEEEEGGDGEGSNSK